MALHITNKKIERRARLVATETGESLTVAVHRALSERLERLTARQDRRVLREQIEEILRRVDRLPTLNTGTDEEILGCGDVM